jgi:uncharacterized protein (TIGR02284 family)
MDTREVCDKLNDLIKLDVDAVHAYDQAIEACTMAEIRDQLTEFRGDHDRHIRELSVQVRALGGEPDVRKDWKGFLIEGFTAIMAQGDRSALMAMRGNEELTNKVYQNAVEMADLTPEIRSLLERNYSDEQRHLQWIKNQLDRRVWEKRAA